MLSKKQSLILDLALLHTDMEEMTEVEIIPIEYWIKIDEISFTLQSFPCSLLSSFFMLRVCFA